MDSNESFLNQDEEADQTPVPKKASISLKDYSDSGRTVTVLGLTEYPKLKGDVFLTLFLEAENNGEEKMYINPYEVSEKLMVKG